MVVQELHNSIIVKWRKGPKLYALTFINGPSVYWTRLIINYKLADLPRTLDGQGPLTMVTLYTHFKKKKIDNFIEIITYQSRLLTGNVYAILCCCRQFQFWAKSVLS
jgi:hypothetical protein